MDTETLSAVFANQQGTIAIFLAFVWWNTALGETKITALYDDDTQIEGENLQHTSMNNVYAMKFTKRLWIFPSSDLFQMKMQWMSWLILDLHLRQERIEQAYFVWIG